MKVFERLAKYCEKTYGTAYIRPDKSGEGDSYFICCECGEPLYEEDWEDEEFIRENDCICPICEYVFCSVYEI